MMLLVIHNKNKLNNTKRVNKAVAAFLKTYSSEKEFKTKLLTELTSIVFSSLTDDIDACCRQQCSAKLF